MVVAGLLIILLDLIITIVIHGYFKTNLQTQIPPDSRK